MFKDSFNIIIISALLVGLASAITSPILNHKANNTNKENHLKKINISTKKYPDTYALIDDDDYDEVSKYKWYTKKTTNVKYATRWFIVDNKIKIEYMHRFILKVKNGFDVDHINHNGLDNRKKNLRVCTRSQNNMNSRKRKNQTSKYKGVYYNKRDNKWVSQIRHNKKTICVGCFLNEIDAAKAYNKAAKKYYGEYANLNKIKQAYKSK